MYVATHTIIHTIYLLIWSDQGFTKKFYGQTDQVTDRQTNLLLEAPSRSLKIYELKVV